MVHALPLKQFDRFFRGTAISLRPLLIVQLSQPLIQRARFLADHPAPQQRDQPGLQVGDRCLVIVEDGCDDRLHDAAPRKMLLLRLGFIGRVAPRRVSGSP